MGKEMKIIKQGQNVLYIREYYHQLRQQIIRFVIPVVFYEITNVECVYSSNTTIACFAT
jgi:hypothetical protein